MTSSCNHVVPGEHIYDGVMYAGIFPDRSLEKIKSFEFRDEDVILATYPKSGEYWPLSLHWLLVVTSIPSARIENFRSIIGLVHDDVIKWKYSYQLAFPKPLTRPFVLKCVKLLGFATQASLPPLQAPWGVTHEWTPFVLPSGLPVVM